MLINYDNDNSYPPPPKKKKIEQYHYVYNKLKKKKDRLVAKLKAISMKPKTQISKTNKQVYK